MLQVSHCDSHHLIIIDLVHYRINIPTMEGVDITILEYRSCGVHYMTSFTSHSFGYDSYKESWPEVHQSWSTFGSDWTLLMGLCERLKYLFFNTQFVHAFVCLLTHLMHGLQPNFDHEICMYVHFDKHSLLRFLDVVNN